nr:Gag-Pol polyprotein [Tanacetum cinerariifolium]
MKKKSNRKSSPIIKTKTIKKPLTSSSPSPSPSLNKTRVKISDLNKTTSLHIDSIKRNIDSCYSDLLKDMDASHTRLQKRFQAQKQACEQSMVEAEKDFKKMINHISETHDTTELENQLIILISKKHNCVSISTAEYEYVAVSSYCAQVLWMRTQLTDYGFFYDKVPIYCDSKSAIAISCNPVQHTRTKHIDVRYHFIKDHAKKGTIELYFVGTEYQLADLFTKSLPEARFKFLVEKLGMMSRET